MAKKAVKKAVKKVVAKKAVKKAVKPAAKKVAPKTVKKAAVKPVVKPAVKPVQATSAELGADRVALAIDAKTGRLTAVQHVPSGGKTPRNFDMDPAGRWMLVTNHGNNVAMVLRIDQATGKLTPVGTPVEVPSPYCPRFLERR